VATIDETGYVAKTQNEYFDEERQLYLNIDPNWNLDPSTPDGLKLASDSEIYGNLDELAQQAYNSKDPSKAEGLELDIVSSLTGTTRSPGTPSNVGLTLFGVASTQIFAGDIVDSGDGTPQWTIDSDVVIDGTGQIAATATCTTNGATQADPNTITRIVTTRGGWQTVTNPTVPTLGTDEQNDTQLRIERAAAVARPGNNQVDNTVGEIFAVEGVRRVAAYENDTGSAAVGPDNPYGLPANSMSYVVDGGSDEDVALAIYVKKNPGVFLNQAGTPVEVTVTSPKYPTNTKVIRFSRPIAVDMVIVIDIVDDGTLPGNVDQLIKDAIIEYTNGELLPADVGFNIQGFNIGENVPLSRINTPINNVIGSYGNSYINGLDINGQTTGAVTIDFNQLARFSDVNITVNVT